MLRIFSIICLCIPYSLHAQVRLLENKGQLPDHCYFSGNLPGGRVFFEKDQIAYQFTDADWHEHYSKQGVQAGEVANVINNHNYFMRFLGGRADSVTGEFKPNTPLHHYFIGDKDKHATGVREVSAITYHDLYKGIDLKYYDLGSTVRYDFVIQPGSSFEAIQYELDGPDSYFIEDGDLHIKTSVQNIIESKPIAYQMIGGKRKNVACEFNLECGVIGFKVAQDYDVCEPLIIDPTLIFSTYSGSTADNWGNTATFDDGGNLYSGGITNHAAANGGTFPATAGAFQTTWAGEWDVAILKYDSLGQNALYATYLGGSLTEMPQSLIADEEGNLYVMGVTGSADFPSTSQAFQNSFNGGASIVPISGLDFPNGSDIYISKLSSDGSELLSSTFFGGTDDDGLLENSVTLAHNYGDQLRGDILLLEDNRIAIASKTHSMDFPLANALQSQLAGQIDAVVSVLSNDLSDLRFSTYIGGANIDAALSIKQGLDGRLFMAGGSTSNAMDMEGFAINAHGSVDGWMAVVNKEMTALDTGFFVGTAQYDQIYFIDLDSDDNIYSFGQTDGSIEILGDVFNQGKGQFLQKYSSETYGLELSTEFGSNRTIADISPTAFLVNDCDNVYLSGWGSAVQGSTLSTLGLPISSDAFQSNTSGNDFYLMTLSADLSTMLYSTFLGGDVSRTHVDGGTSRFDKRGFVYHAVCAGCGGVSDFPATENAWSTTNNSENCNNAAFKFDLASLRAVIQPNSVDMANPGKLTYCFEEVVVFENLSIGGVEYTWDFGNGETIKLTDKETVTTNYSQPGSYKVTLTAVDGNTCQGQDVDEIIINISKPELSVIDSIGICEGQSVRLFASGASNYFWNTADSAFTSAEQNPLVNPIESTEYFVKTFDTPECFVLDTVFVEVTSKVSNEIRITKESDCFSRSVVKLNYLGDEDTQITWNLDDGQTRNDHDFIYHYQADGVYEIRLEAYNDNCVYDTVTTISVNTIKVPNVFTPNADEFNNTFNIISGNAPVDLKIYNRWGRLIYDADDYQDDWMGEDEPAGIYYYEADIVDEQLCKGWVHILK